MSKVEPLPTSLVVPSPFEFTLFTTRYAHGSKKSDTRGKNVHEFVEAGHKTWKTYCEWHDQYSAQVVPKASARNPCFIHGDCDGWHGTDDVLSVTALVLDCDKTHLPEDQVDAFLRELNGVRYLFQWRAGKFHVVLPLADAWYLGADDGLDADQARARRLALIKYFSARWGRVLDPSLAPVASVLHPYCRREESDQVPITRYSMTPTHFDAEAMLVENGHRDQRPKSTPTGTYKQDVEYGNTILKALGEAGYLLGPMPVDGPDGKCPCKCPFHPEDRLGALSTIVYKSGHIHCSHARCAGHTQQEFLAKIPGSKHLLGDFPSSIQLYLAGLRTEKVSVAEAHTRILATLTSAKAHERDASVIKVTTGAGKTAAVAEFLNGYSAPRYDDETGDLLPGRSAFLAVPTNALLREVDKRLNVDHRVVTGVLSVLNDDGSPACQKHTIAKRLQSSGGDVHRLLCEECEYKEGCPARLGASRGGGALTLTNHACLPALVRAAARDGLTPLVVWDESPPFVETVTLLKKDLAWFLEQFDLEDDTRRPVTPARLAQFDLFSERFRIAWRPLMEVLRGFVGRGADGLGASVAGYTATRLYESQIHRAETTVGAAEGAGDPWTRIWRVAAAAYRVNKPELMYDKMPESAQAHIDRGARIQKTLEMLLGEASEASLKEVLGGYTLSRITPHGLLWRDFGGVIMDATASEADLRALRPDMTIEDIAVKDAGTSGDDETKRLLVPTTGLARTVLKAWPVEGGKRLEHVVEHLRKALKEQRKKLDRDLKVLVVTYKSEVETIKNMVQGIDFAAFDVRYYGNIRGYDAWFQDGYDAVVTIGDPFSNMDATDAAYDLLGVKDMERFAYSQLNADAELGQAHGRGRAPQRKKRDGFRYGLHYGKRVPAGWDAENTIISSNGVYDDD